MMKRDFWFVASISLLLTVIGEIVVHQVSFFPKPLSDKGRDIDDAFKILMVLAVPVFMLVVSALVYTVLRHRSRGVPDADGAPIFGRGAVPVAWLGVTTALTLLIMVFPGLTSLAKVIGNDPNPDLVVKVHGVQWAWLVNYPAQNVNVLDEMVLPVGKTVRFEISSGDVIHSFWIPAFRMKQDAVPGLTTVVTVRPTETGAFENDPTLRLQCSQLCGLDHARMRMPVRVVTPQEWAGWLQARAGSAVPPSRNPAAGNAATGGAPAGSAKLSLSAKHTRFSTAKLEVQAGLPLELSFENQDDGVVHNLAFYSTKDGNQPIAGARTALAAGPVTQQLAFTVPTAGTYFYRCDAHAGQMTGTLVVK